jgi:hypothetical protein
MTHPDGWALTGQLRKHYYLEILNPFHLHGTQIAT